MILARIAGLERIADTVDLPAMLEDPVAGKALLPVLREAALAVLWSGLSLETFASLSRAEREAAVDAGMQFQIEMACRIGRAARGSVGEAQARVEIDDGDAVEEAVAGVAFAKMRAHDVRIDDVRRGLDAARTPR